MSEHQLPEDLTRWPADPYELLGVSRGCTALEVKRSYTRLIKLFKPEHHPDQFRRIRDAYEQVLRLMEWFGPNYAPGRPQSRAPSAATDDVGSDRNYAHPLSAVAQGELDGLWRQAIAGEDAESYRALLRLHRERPDRCDVLVRLYWLLSVKPDLDAERDPREWLVAGLCSGGPSGSCWELYRREVEAEPAEALSARYDRLLRSETSPAQFADILRMRLPHLCQSHQWTILQSDLMLARESQLRCDEESWLGYLVDGLAHLAWSDHIRTNEKQWELCWNEIKSLEHLGTRQSAVFDRVDWLQAVRAGMVPLRTSLTRSQLLELLGRGALEPFAKVQRDLLAILVKIDDRSSQWLEFLDGIERRAPAVLAQFGILLRQLEHRQESYVSLPDSATRARLAADFLRNHAASEYTQMRPGLMTFCQDESVAPEWIAEAVQNGDVPGVPADHSIGQLLAKDWPLRYVCWARRLIWS